jgi:hypothetical protein
MASEPTRGRIGGGDRRTGDSQAAGDAPAPGERGRVIPFVPRPGAPGPRGLRPALRPRQDPVADLARYETGEDADDYRHRMITNVAAFLLLGLLTAGGLWIASTMADMRKNQDCVLSGRPGCTPVALPVQPPGPDRAAGP